MNIIAHSGVIGGGKDHQCFILIKDQGFVRVDFKTALCEMAYDLVGYDIRMEYDWFKEAIVGVRKPAHPLLEMALRAQMKELRAKCPGIVTGRILLQRLGTEVMRSREADYWVKEWSKRVDAAAQSGAVGVACGDCRFPNEIRAVMMLGGEVRFCDYHSHRYDALATHKSERMAQIFLRMGLRDGDLILAKHVYEMEKLYEEAAQ